MKKAICLLLALALTALSLTALAAKSRENPKPPPPKIEEKIEEYQTIYRLRIRYLYLNGSTAAPTYTKQLAAGTPYNVPSPNIPGYTPTIYVVSGVMPARDMEYTVFYIPASVPETEPEKKPEGTPEDEPKDVNVPTPNLFSTIEDYESPLGLGATNMTVGVCVD